MVYWDLNSLSITGFILSLAPVDHEVINNNRKLLKRQMYSYANVLQSRSIVIVILTPALATHKERGDNNCGWAPYLTKQLDTVVGLGWMIKV